MNLNELQAELRHFAAEREWEPFHTPKNLATALMVEAAELAEIFQWMTPEASLAAHEDVESGQRIGAEVADVLLYLLQVADRCRIDLERAVRDKLARNAEKYPAKRAIARVSPARASVPGSHVLLDYENVQPTAEEVRALVPDARQVWVFHGPHQRDVARRYASFGQDVTAVPISKSGKNALDFHLSFYMGYIASRNPGAVMAVIANDKGYEPMLEHARAMGFAVRRVTHGKAKAAARKAAATKKVATTAGAKASVANEQAAKKVAPRKATVGKTPARTTAPHTAPNTAPHTAPRKTAPSKAAPKSAAPRKAAPSKAAPSKAAPRNAATRKAAPSKAAPSKAAKAPTEKGASLQPAVETTMSTKASTPRGATSARTGRSPRLTVERLADKLRSMGAKRPTKEASLRRWLKSLVGDDEGEDAVDRLLGRLVADGVVALGAATGASYPGFAADDSTT